LCCAKGVESALATGGEKYKTMRSAAIGLVLSIFASAAPAQRAAPTDNELYSQYCLAVLNAQIDWTKKGLTDAAASAKNLPPEPPTVQLWVAKQRAEIKQSLTKLESARNRLQSYLVPRYGTVDTVAMVAAMNRGTADWQNFLATSNRCGIKCVSAPHDQMQGCLTACADAALIGRIQACANPTWLQF
jgi:hypothetical protein